MKPELQQNKEGQNGKTKHTDPAIQREPKEVWCVTAAGLIVVHQLYVGRDKHLFSPPPDKPVAKGRCSGHNICGQVLSATGSFFQRATPCQGASKPNAFI